MSRMRSSWAGSVSWITAVLLGLIEGNVVGGERSVSSTFRTPRREEIHRAFPGDPPGTGRAAGSRSGNLRPAMRSFRLTYCGNVHACYELESWLRAVGECVAPVAAAAAAAGRAFGLGSWWPAPLALALATDDAVCERVRAELAARSLELWTLNVFPHDRFHDAAVKTAVYTPDWAQEERLVYTRHCAEAAAALSRPGALLPLSTLPLGYRGPRDPPADLRLMARNLARAASALAALRERTGVHCVLAL